MRSIGNMFEVGDLNNAVLIMHKLNKVNIEQKSLEKTLNKTVEKKNWESSFRLFSFYRNRIYSPVHREHSLEHHVLQHKIVLANLVRLKLCQGLLGQQ